MSVVFDSSAVLALIWLEPGHDVVEAHMNDATISAANIAEVYTKCADRGLDIDEVRDLISEMKLAVAPFDEGQAFRSGRLRLQTRQKGLSLGDRACLALAESLDAKVVTSDRVWQTLGLDIDIISIR